MRWGGYWGQLWGSGPKRENWEQGSTVDAKQDTIFLGKSASGTWSELATDLSQHGSDLTVGTSPRIYDSSPGSQWSFVGSDEWTFELDGEWNNSLSGAELLWKLSWSGGDITVQMVTSGRVNVDIGGSIITLTGVATSLVKRMTVGIAVRAHRDTTGASNAIRVYGYLMDRFGNIDVKTAETSRAWTGIPTLVEFFDGAGENALTTATVYAIRVSKAFHSVAEVREDFLQRSPAIARTAERRAERHVVEADSDSDLAGPLHRGATAAVREAGLRCVGPVINMVVPATYTLTANGGIPSPSQWFVKSFDDSVWLGLQWLTWRPLPFEIERVRVRVYVTPGSTGTIGCYSYARRPGQSSTAGGVIGQAFGVTAAVSSAGWVDLGWLDIARDLDGGTYFCLGIDAATTMAVNAWTIEPGVT